jgi:uncharacterized protein
MRCVVDPFPLRIEGRPPMTTFTPIASFAGGLMIGLSAVLLMALTGRIAGISGILARLLPPFDGASLPPAAAFMVGLILAPLAIRATGLWTTAQTISGNLVLLVLAGLLGHGVCGLARCSVRSFVATATFMASAVVTVFLVRHVFGG